jgi:hypothetical protein
MRIRLWMLLAASPLVSGWGASVPQWPHVGPIPDDPARRAPSDYRSITAGTKSYRPAEPLPWGDINRGVASPGALDPKRAGAPKNGKPAVPQRPAPQHKH